MLAVGNFLNAGSFNGAAQGFQLEVLLKLKEVRSRRSKQSTQCELLPAAGHSFSELSPRAPTASPPVSR